MGPMGPDERGCKYLAVAVDVFSKWVEATPLTDKRAFTTCEWVFDSILARWGRVGVATRRVSQRCKLSFCNAAVGSEPTTTQT